METRRDMATLSAWSQQRRHVAVQYKFPPFPTSTDSKGIDTWRCDLVFVGMPDVPTFTACATSKQNAKRAAAAEAVKFLAACGYLDLAVDGSRDGSRDHGRRACNVNGDGGGDSDGCGRGRDMDILSAWSQQQRVAVQYEFPPYPTTTDSKGINTWKCDLILVGAKDKQTFNATFTAYATSKLNAKHAAAAEAVKFLIASDRCGDRDNNRCRSSRRGKRDRDIENKENDKSQQQQLHRTCSHQQPCDEYHPCEPPARSTLAKNLKQVFKNNERNYGDPHHVKSSFVGNTDQKPTHTGGRDFPLSRDVRL